jgi:hypothetical protein
VFLVFFDQQALCSQFPSLFTAPAAAVDFFFPFDIFVSRPAFVPPKMLT